MRSKASLQIGWRCSTMNGTSRARTSSAAREPKRWPVRVKTEPGVEEPGVVGAELARGGVVGHHLGRVIGGHADALGGDRR